MKLKPSSRRQKHLLGVIEGKDVPPRYGYSDPGLPQPTILERIQSADRPVCLPIVTRLELLRGRIEAVIKAANVQELLRAEDALARTEAFCSGFAIVAIGIAAAELFVRLRDNKRVKKIGRGDLLNACISLANDATLVTRNLKDYANVPGLRVENWAG